MLLTPHTLVGITIGSQIKNPYFALPLAFLSHFLGDYVPHWDFFTPGQKLKRKVVLLGIVVDFLLGLGVGLFFTFKAFPDYSRASVIFFSAFLANLPDGLETPYIFLGKKWKWVLSIISFQSSHQSRLRFPWGLLTQILVSALCLWILL